MSEQDDFHALHLSPSQWQKLQQLLPPQFWIDRLGQKRSRPNSQNRGGQRKKPHNYVFTDREAGLRTGGVAAQKCYNILKKLKRHVLAGPFLQAVDSVLLSLPDYLEIIRDPIDLSTVEANLRTGHYTNSQQFATDVRRIWLNSFRYSENESEMFYITLEMSTYFEKHFRKVENLVFSNESKVLVRDKQALRNYMDKPMSRVEQLSLSASLKFLLKNKELQYQSIKDLVKTRGPVQTDKLPPSTARQLEKMVKLRYQAMCRSNRHAWVKNMNALNNEY